VAGERVVDEVDEVDQRAAAPVGVDLPALTAYLGEAIELAGPLRADLMQGGRSNLTYRLTDGAHDWVLRRPPLGHVLPTAHDMAREFRVLEGLAGSDIPAPGPVVLCRDPAVLGCDFYVMERVEGPVLRDAAHTAGLDAATAARIADDLVDTLVTMHAAVPEALADLGRPDGFMARQVRRWHRQWDLSATRSLPELTVLVDRLAAAVPPPQAASIVHGDYRLDNLILRPAYDGVAAIVDWEMATLGDPLADLGLLLVYWNPVTESVTGSRHPIAANSGFPGADAVAERYARGSGRDLADLGFYVAFGYLKLAVIAEGIHARYLAGETVGDGFDRVGAVVPDLVSAGLASAPS
jgi:aminoglycoside phosphotransferase (APT) family kinase protein